MSALRLKVPDMLTSFQEGYTGDGAVGDHSGIVAGLCAPCDFFGLDRQVRVGAAFKRKRAGANLRISDIGIGVRRSKKAEILGYIG